MGCIDKRIPRCSGRDTNNDDLLWSRLVHAAYAKNLVSALPIELPAERTHDAVFPRIVFLQRFLLWLDLHFHVTCITVCVPSLIAFTYDDSV
jgi:hypothetical protein